MQEMIIITLRVYEAMKKRVALDKGRQKSIIRERATLYALVHPPVIFFFNASSLLRRK